MVGGHPLSHCEPQSVCAQETGSKASLEHRRVTVDPSVSQPRESYDVRVEEIQLDSDGEYQDSREYQNVPGSLTASIAVHQLAPDTQSSIIHTTHTSQNPESEHPATSQEDAEDSGETMGDIPMGELLENAKFYQDAAFEYQSAYEALCLQQEELQSRYTQ